MRVRKHHVLFALVAVMASAAGLLWAFAGQDGKTPSEWWEQSGRRWEEFQDRRRTAAIVKRSTSATYVGIGVYMDGGSIGYLFTNQVGHFTLFLPNPWMREDWDQDKAAYKVLDQELFLGPTESGEGGIRVKVGSALEQKLMKLVESAETKVLEKERKEELAQLMKVIRTREFDWKHFAQ